MELEEMQAVWSEMSDQLEKQKKLTNKMIIMMTQQKYRNKINKIRYYEIAGTIICYIAVIVILLNFHKLESWYNIVCGIISSVILLVLPIFSLKPLGKMKDINIGSNTYKETLITYTKNKEKYFSLQKLSYYISFLLMFAILPVTTKIFNNKDLFADTSKLWSLFIFIALGSIFLFFFTKWVVKCTTNTINAAGDVLKELEEE